MPFYGGFPFTGFRGVNLKNTAAIRFEGDGATSSTLSVRPSLDAARAWYFPDKTGTFPIMGTFNVSLPVVTAGEYYRTAVTVSGVRIEDAIMVSVQGDPLVNRGAVQEPAQIIAVKAGNGSITLTFATLGGTASAYQEIPCAYVVMR